MDKQKCYYEHEGSEDILFDCYDEENKVCARCCVEVCQNEENVLYSACLAAGHPTWLKTEQLKLAPNKLICLETYWNSGQIFNELSVKPFLTALLPLLRNNLKIGHRFVETLQGMKYYTLYPNGVLWKDELTFDNPLFYLAFHGKAGSVYSVLDEIDSKNLCEAFSDYGQYNNIIYFSACGIFRGTKGKKFAKDFLASSGTRAIFGYTEDVGWMESIVVDLLFIERFYKDDDPFNHLDKIYNSIMDDFKPAKALGFSMFTNS